MWVAFVLDARHVQRHSLRTKKEAVIITAAVRCIVYLSPSLAAASEHNPGLLMLTSSRKEKRDVYSNFQNWVRGIFFFRLLMTTATTETKTRIILG